MKIKAKVKKVGEVKDGKVHVTFVDDDGVEYTVEFDHRASAMEPGQILEMRSAGDAATAQDVQQFPMETKLKN